MTTTHINEVGVGAFTRPVTSPFDPYTIVEIRDQNTGQTLTIHIVDHLHALAASIGTAKTREEISDHTARTHTTILRITVEDMARGMTPTEDAGP